MASLAAGITLTAKVARAVQIATRIDSHAAQVAGDALLQVGVIAQGSPDIEAILLAAVERRLAARREQIDGGARRRGGLNPDA